MADQMTRRETLKRGLVAASVLALVPEWALPALAQGEADVPFTDIPATFNPTNPTGANRFLDIRKIDGLITPNDQFFFIQHYNKPEIDRGRVPPEAHRPGQQADRVDAGGSQGHEVGRHRQRLRMLRQQPARDAGALVERPVHGRTPARRAQAGRRGRPRRGKWSSSAPTAARKTSCSVSRRSRSSSSSRAASRSRTR